MTRIVLLTCFMLLLTAGIALLPFASAEGQWTRFSGNPIIPTPSWATAGVYRPRVLFDGSMFRMWFSGIAPNGNPLGIGYASSVNGSNWTVNPQPVLSASSNNWEGSYISVGSVIWTGTDFVMWYRGVRGQAGSAQENGAVGLATSQNGITWLKYSGNPVMTTGGVDVSFLSTPFVVQTGLNFRMLYTCKNPMLSHDAICTASSADGKTWTKNSSPVLTSDAGKWDAGDLYSPSVIYDGSVYGMWYTGLSSSGIEPKIGYATSKDGIAWTKDANNPILSVGSSGAWDAGNVENQCAIQTQGGYLLYYDGSGTGQTGLSYIGVAQSPANFTIPELTSPVLVITLTMMFCLCVVKIRRSR